MEANPDNTNKINDFAKITLIMDIIKRYDSYIVSTNTKASLIIAFNSLILGTVLLRFSDIISFSCSLFTKVAVSFLLVLLSASSLCSLFFIFIVIYPYFGRKDDKKEQERSLIYFGSIAKMSGREYFENFNRITIEELVADLSGQAVILAAGLQTKMLRMRRSIEAITFSLVLILVLVISKALNLFCS